jgi:holliday junction DNA helicase RuvA
MITRITGNLTRLGDDMLTLGVGPLEYEVLIPEFTRRQLQDRVGSEISLFTIDYLEGNPAHGKLVPRLIGFLTEVEREFFEQFCSVDGVGVKKALRAMVRPVRETATLIEEQDVKGLSSLPGIGPAFAERVIAKLRRKMSKFALLVTRDLPPEAKVEADVVRDTYNVLVGLGHNEREARRMLDAALGEKKTYKDVESLLQAVYQQSHRRE